MHPMETILGTKIKIRILDILAHAAESMTRNQIAKQIGSMQGTYDQGEVLIGVGVLTD